MSRVFSIRLALEAEPRCPCRAKSLKRLCFDCVCVCVRFLPVLFRFATERVGEMPPPAPGALGLRVADGAARDPRAQPRHLGHHPGQRRPDAFTVRTKIKKHLLSHSLTCTSMCPNEYPDPLSPIFLPCCTICSIGDHIRWHEIPPCVR